MLKHSNTGNWKFHFDEVSLEKASHNINQPFIQTRHPKLETYLWREGAKTTLQGCSSLEEEVAPKIIYMSSS